MRPREIASISELRVKHKWPTQEDLRRNQRLTLLYEVVNSHIAVSPEMLQLEYSDRRTRQNHKFKFKEKGSRSDKCKYSFVNCTIPEWNRLPAAVAAAGSLSSFRSQLVALLD